MEVLFFFTLSFYTFVLRGDSITSAGNLSLRNRVRNRDKSSVLLVDVRSFGARANDHRDHTKAFVAAWDEACKSSSRSVDLIIPRGEFYVGPLKFSGPCTNVSKLTVRVKGHLKASTDLSKYRSGGGWIEFGWINGLILTGGGTFDGQGALAWPFNNCTTDSNCKLLPTSLKFVGMNRTVVRRISSVNSKFFHMALVECRNFKGTRLNITAPFDSPNTDGIHIERSSNVYFSRSHIATGDDCVSIGQGNSQITITSIKCGPGHGISVGSLGRYPNEKDVKGLVVRDCKMSGTTNGIRIKTWADSPGLSAATNMTFQNIMMDNVTNPIIIDQSYCPFSSCTSNVPSKVKLSEIYFKNIRGTSSSRVAVQLHCSRGMPCKKVYLENVHLSLSSSGGGRGEKQSRNRGSEAVSSSCRNMECEIIGRRWFMSRAPTNNFRLRTHHLYLFPEILLPPIPKMEVESETQELHIHVNGEPARKFSTEQRSHNYSWRLRVSLYVTLLLAGETIATLLGRLYYDKGGNSTWLETLVQLVGFPLTLPCYYYIKAEPSKTKTINKKTTSSFLTLSLVYVGLGLLAAGHSVLYSFGLLYLPVSTFSLISASQLAFNAVFSYFLNSQKFTPFILNSLVLLTTSSALLVIQEEPESSTSKSLPKSNYVIGYICAIGSSAGYSLVLSLTDYAFRKILKKYTFKAILDMVTYQSLVATCAVVVGLFGSGGWRMLRTEMEEFGLGKSYYLLITIGATISWQACSFGSVGLILEVSSLFSNVISTLCLPVVPVLAVVFFRDEMSGIKLVAMLMAIWGFVSYAYQHYVDDRKLEEEKKLTQPEEEEELQEDNSNIQA
ncbi:unnamed protein product [Thlaspi arvense]|uniref:Uncharacterized protein n=1 Tax=Thlaspi arvense TaxID=13288 RepID=A0AAU9T7P4_THLAR|nr:unnamed protein product [Thlaspi arvense]